MKSSTRDWLRLGTRGAGVRGLGFVFLRRVWVRFFERIGARLDAFGFVFSSVDRVRFFEMFAVRPQGRWVRFSLESRAMFPYPTSPFERQYGQNRLNYKLLCLSRSS
jgi:hypothetical protein